MRKNSGFTLIEITIVMIILGFIVVGIIEGTALINQAKLKTVYTSSGEYIDAVEIFKDKYKYLPGDMPNAESFWGADSSCPNTAANTVKKTATCNGNGNNKIYFDSNDSYEIHRFWQHLSNAELIGQEFTGAQVATSNIHVLPGVNSPSTDYPLGTYTVDYHGFVSSSSTVVFGENDYGHTLEFGSIGPADEGMNPYGIISPEDAYYIDNKFDDGSPALGKIQAQPDGHDNAPNCTDANDISAAYDLSQTNTNCRVIFITGF